MRLLSILLLMFVSIEATYAESLNPATDNLATEQLFSGKYNKEKGVTVSISIKNGKISRNMTVTKNPAMAKIIIDAFNTDRKRASSFNQYIDSDFTMTSIRVPYNGEDIKIGLNQDDTDGEIMLMLTGSEKAFNKQ